ncbi:methyltransferase small domain protein [Tanacetum coccineum]
MYRDAGINIDKLRKLQANVIHNVDAMSLSEDKRLRNKRYHRILFFFPHAGFFPGWSETEPRMIGKHRKLLSPFLEHATQMLYPGGEIHITNKSTPPFSDWGIVEMAERAGLKLLRETKFTAKNFPGYTNKRGSGKMPDKWFKMGECSTEFKSLEPSEEIEVDLLVNVSWIQVFKWYGIRGLDEELEVDAMYASECMHG